jgi:hypothetical protein
MNLEKVVFGVFIVLAATLNFGFFIGELSPVTVDRIRTSWIVAAIEQYVGWLAERRYSKLPPVQPNSRARLLAST